MRNYDVVIIGGGLGGLECGYILSKQGYSVCILEQNPQLGGCLQTFRRAGLTLDTGFHYVGALDEGQFLHRLFGYFDLLGLPWHRMDEQGFAEVVIEDKPYLFAMGYERFAEKLAKEFPHQRKELGDYTAMLRRVGDNIAGSFGGWSGQDSNMELFERPASGFLRDTVSDPLLRDVLSGGSLTMELCEGTLPLYTFAQINGSFIQSAWRLHGGGSLIADKLAGSIRSMGGEIVTKARAGRLIEKDGIITQVEYGDGLRIGARHVISNLHPAATLELLPESPSIRKIYRKRMTGLPNTYGMFTTHLKLKENTVPYLDRNIFIHKNRDLWNCGQASDKVSSALVSYQVPEKGGAYTRNIDILTPMQWEQVSRWEDTRIGRRGDDYEEFKARKAEQCIALAGERIPELKDNVEKIFTSSPLTYRDYTAAPQGSAYGVRKDCDNVMATMLSPQTPVANLLLTGQNLNLHGILGVTMTSFFTCAKITGMEALVGELN